MKRRILSLLLVITMVSTLMFAGCGQDTVEKTDATMKKGEFIELFVEKMGLYSDKSSHSVSIDKSNKYYAAVITLSEYKYVDDKILEKDLDKAVTKEFVATVCANSMYFREECTDVELKDIEKLNDKEACRDAVGMEIVNIENGWFDALETYDYKQCIAAINKTIDIEANGEFEGDGECEVTLKDDVVDLSSEIEPEDIYLVEPGSELFEEILKEMDENQNQPAEAEQIKYNTGSAKATSLAYYTDVKFIETAENTTNKTGGYCSIDEISGDTIGQKMIVGLPKGKKYQVGDKILYNRIKEQSVYDDITKVYRRENLSFWGEIVAKAEGHKSVDVKKDYYEIIITPPDEIIEEAKYNKKTFKYSEAVKFSAEFELSDDVKKWSDPSGKVKFKYDFSIKDIEVTADGIGSLMNNKVDNDIVFKVKYTISHNASISTALKYAPANNGNGKFWSNLKRSRLTAADSKGAKTIKVGNIKIDLGYGFIFNVPVKLKVGIDGSINLVYDKTYVVGVKYSSDSGKWNTIQENPETKKEINVNAQIEVSIIALPNISWLCINLIDAEATATLGLRGKATIYSDGKDSSTKDENTYYAGEEVLKRVKECDKENKMGYCIDEKLYFKLEAELITDASIAGKIARLVKNDFKLYCGTGEINLYSIHFEDGKKVSECTRGKDDKEDDEDGIKTDSENFMLKNYKEVLPEGTCTRIDITGLPATLKELDDMGGIEVYSENESVAVVYMTGDTTIEVEAVSPGTTNIKIRSGNHRFEQDCSITVNEIQ